MNRSRLTITKTLHNISYLYYKSTNSIFHILRRFISKFIAFMDSPFSSQYHGLIFSPPSDESCRSPSLSDYGESTYLVPFRWWKEAVCGGGVVNCTNGVYGVVYNATVEKLNNGDDEIVVRMSREGECGISGEEKGELALVSEWMFLTALKWHYDEKDVESLLPEEDGADDLFSLKIKLLYVRKTTQLVINISQKDNGVTAFKRGYGIFCTKYGMFQIWDFSGQTNNVLVNDIKSSVDSGQPNEEISLELQIYGWSSTIKDENRRKEDMLLEQSNVGCSSPNSPLTTNDCVDELNLFRTSIEICSGFYGTSALDLTGLYNIGNTCVMNSAIQSTIKDKNRRKEDMLLEQSNVGCSSSNSSLTMNGNVDELNLFPPSIEIGSGFYGTSALGLTGLHNIGNTCFMNSAIQCLVHTPKMVDYFLGNFREDLNFGNPLGMKGELAVAFGHLLRKMWSPGAKTVFTSMFKPTVCSFAPQFSGYNQHDSQEFLSFFLDGLHEDLNRVKIKPYIQAKDEYGRPDEEVADEYWANHLARNDSIIVDLCQGQYRSTLVCPVCLKVSIKFDPFMYLSLPLPSTTSRKMIVSVLSSDGTNLPRIITTTVPRNGTLKDLIEAVGKACSLRDNETLVIAETYNCSIIRFLDGPDDAIELIRDCDQLVAYRLPKHTDGSHLIVFMHERQDEPYLQSPPSFKKFGVPLVSRMSDFSKGSEMHKEFLKLIAPVLQKQYTVWDEFKNDFEFYLEEGPFHLRGVKVDSDKPVPIPNPFEPIKVLVSWPEKMIQKYNTVILSELPEVAPESAQDPVSLYECVDAFLKEEPLGSDDMWYCPKCKEHRQASKKLDLWRLPQILVIHLKRFSYTRLLKKKLETFVVFPIEEFDLSNYVIQKNNSVSHRYMLYAVSNHHGGTDGGHYTAFAKHKLKRWYEFNDSHVSRVSEEQIRTPAAYILFYKRI